MTRADTPCQTGCNSQGSGSPPPPENGFTETGSEIALSLGHEVHSTGWSRTLWRGQTLELCKGASGKNKNTMCGGDPTKASAEHFTLRRRRR